MTHPHQHQHGVTIGDRTYLVDENGKFVPNHPKHHAAGAGNNQNGNNKPKEHA